MTVLGSFGWILFTACSAAAAAVQVGDRTSASPFRSEYDPAQVADAAHLPAELRATLNAVPSLPGALLEAEVRIEHYSQGDSIRNRRSGRLTGTVLADGRFDVEHAKAVEHEGRAAVSTSRIRFDGQALIEVCSAAEVGNVYLPESVDFERSAHALCHPIEPLFRWVAKPARMGIFADARYTVVTQDGVHRISRWVDWGGQEVVSELLRVDAASSLPLSWSVFDSAGRTRHFVQFDGYRPLSPGAVRPTRIVETTYLEGDLDGPRVVVTTRVDRATLLEESELGAAQFAQDQVYQVWR